MELWTGALSCWKCPLTRFEECWSLPTESSSWTPLKPQQYSLLTVSLFSGNLVHVDHASAVKKKDHQKFVGWICSVWPSCCLGEPACFPLGTLSLGLSSRSSFHRRSPEHQELQDLNWSARPSPCCHDNVFLSDLLWAPLGQTSRKSSASSVPRE